MEKIVHSVEEFVREDLTAAQIGSGQLPVYATPALLALVEKCAWQSIAGLLAPGETTVGTHVELDHLAASALGQTLKATTTLIEHEGRKFVFEFEVHDGATLAAKGRHERFVVASERFVAKTVEKALAARGQRAWPDDLRERERCYEQLLALAPRMDQILHELEDYQDRLGSLIDYYYNPEWRDARQMYLGLGDLEMPLIYSEDALPDLNDQHEERLARLSAFVRRALEAAKRG